MITKIEIKNFKSLEDIALDLSNLNVITGINGMGKSSLIQTLLLLRQAYVPNSTSRGIRLKGPLTGNLGDFNDVLFRNSLNEKIEFTLQVESSVHNWVFTKGPIDDLLQGVVPDKSELATSLFSDSNFQYISAARVTPTTNFSKSSEALAFRQFGSNGEYAIQYLVERGTDESALISDDLDPHTNKPLPLINQVDFWLKKLTPNVSLDIRPKSSSEYELRYKYLNGDKGFLSFSAINSAFGLTFALPIITTVLSAKPGDLIILENPESDLHPRAQSIIGQLIARAAAAGVQIILETHSDHILNGICVAIHKNLLTNTSCKFYYFYKTETEIRTSAFHVGIKPDGRMDDKDLRAQGVVGFFDQATNDLSSILFSE